MVRNLIILIVTIFGFINNLRATHLVGGSLRYEFIQSVDTDNNGFIDAVDYRIIMNYYYNCDPTANNVYEFASLTNPEWMPGGSQYTIVAGCMHMMTQQQFILKQPQVTKSMIRI